MLSPKLVQLLDLMKADFPLPELLISTLVSETIQQAFLKVNKLSEEIEKLESLQKILNKSLVKNDYFSIKPISNFVKQIKMNVEEIFLINQTLNDFSSDSNLDYENMKKFINKASINNAPPTFLNFLDDSNSIFYVNSEENIDTDNLNNLDSELLRDQEINNPIDLCSATKDDSEYIEMQNDNDSSEDEHDV